MAGPKGSKYYNIYLDFSIYLKHREDGNPVLSEEHFELLLNIGELGSLAATAERMQISYRKAWDCFSNRSKRLDFH